MRISELSEQTDVPIATLKYYLREGLLMPGTATGATRADYGQRHVDRVRLIRALIDVGGLSVAGARGVIDALVDDPDPTLDVVGHVHSALPTSEATDDELARADAFVESLGWSTNPCNPGRAALGSALSAVEAAGLTIPDERLRRYAASAREIAEVDLDAALSSRGLAGVLHTVVVGTVMVDPVISALRRLAQEHVAHERLGAG